jgi:hypothetical protein
VVGARRGEHVQAGSGGIVWRDRAAEYGEEDEQSEHAQAEAPAPGVEQQVANAQLGHVAWTRGSRKK